MAYSRAALAEFGAGPTPPDGHRRHRRSGVRTFRSLPAATATCGVASPGDLAAQAISALAGRATSDAKPLDERDRTVATADVVTDSELTSRAANRRHGSIGHGVAHGWLLAALACAFSPIAPSIAAAEPPVELPAATVSVGASSIRVYMDPTEYMIGRDPILAWVERSAEIVRGYYGFFPAAKLSVYLQRVDGDAVRGGHAEDESGLLIRVGLGRDVTNPTLLHDWVLVHEMVHLALPGVRPRHSWLSEGIATYVEGVARVQAGNMTAAELWSEYRSAMPKGLPAAGDEGLDQTHTWARTYWGGALFCLVADTEIHERSNNRLGLQEALRAVARASGGMTAAWPIEKIIANGDAATGTTVLSDLYAAWRQHPVDPSLAALWQRLGLEGGGDAAATGAGVLTIAEAITQRRSPGP